MSIANDRAELQLTHVCPGCAERDLEIQQLQEQLAALRPAKTSPRPFGWWLGAAIGTCLLGIVPVITMLAAIRLSMIDFGGDFVIIFLQGGMIASPVAQSSFIGLFVLLHWRPRRFRLAFGFAFAVFFGALMLLPGLVDEEFNDLFGTLLPTLPMAMSIAMLPVFAMRATYRWTLALRGQDAQMRPVTLTSFFLLVGFCGMASAAMRLIDVSDMGVETTLEAVVGFLMYVGVPAATVGCISVILLPAILDRQEGRFRRWIIRALMIAVIAIIGPTLLCVVVLFVPLNDATLNKEMVFALCGYCAGATVFGLAISSAVFLWLRWLGYELLSKRGSALPAS